MHVTLLSNLGHEGTLFISLLMTFTSRLPLQTKAFVEFNQLITSEISLLMSETQPYLIFL